MFSTRYSSVIYKTNIESNEALVQKKSEFLMSYKTLFKVIWSTKTGGLLEEILNQQVSRLEFDIMEEELPLLVRNFDDYVRDNLFIIRKIVQMCDYSRMHKIETYIQLNGCIIIETSLLNLLKQSLKWNSYEQILLWKIVNAHSSYAFQTRENFVYSLCYSINTLPNLEEYMEFIDGAFLLLKVRFKQQREINMEEMSHLFGVKAGLGRHVYKVMESITNDAVVILEKLISEFNTKKETQKLTNAFEFMRLFIEIDEKSDGSVMKNIKDSAFKIFLKGILPTVTNQISPKTIKVLNKLIKS